MNKWLEFPVSFDVNNYIRPNELRDFYAEIAIDSIEHIQTTRKNDIRKNMGVNYHLSLPKICKEEKKIMEKNISENMSTNLTREIRQLIRHSILVSEMTKNFLYIEESKIGTLEKIYPLLDSRLLQPIVGFILDHKKLYGSDPTEGHLFKNIPKNYATTIYKSYVFTEVLASDISRIEGLTELSYDNLNELVHYNPNDFIESNKSYSEIEIIVAREFIDSFPIKLNKDINFISKLLEPIPITEFKRFKLLGRYKTPEMSVWDWTQKSLRNHNQVSSTLDKIVENPITRDIVIGTLKKFISRYQYLCHSEGINYLKKKGGFRFCNTDYSVVKTIIEDDHINKYLLCWKKNNDLSKISSNKLYGVDIEVKNSENGSNLLIHRKFNSSSFEMTKDSDFLPTVHFIPYLMHILWRLREYSQKVLKK